MNKTKGTFDCRTVMSGKRQYPPRIFLLSLCDFTLAPDLSFDRSRFLDLLKRRAVLKSKGIADKQYFRFRELVGRVLSICISGTVREVFSKAKDLNSSQNRLTHRWKQNRFIKRTHCQPRDQ